MTASSARAVFDRGTAAFNGHDMEAFASLMADDVEVRAPGGVELHGRDEAAAFYGAWLEAFPDGRVDITAVHVAGDIVVEEGVFRGTHRAPLRGPSGEIDATGRTVAVEYMQVLQLRGDEIAAFHLMFDNLQLLGQLGVATGGLSRGSTTPRPQASEPAAHAH